MSKPPSVIVHAGIILGRSKRLKSQLYSPLIALSCFSQSIVASHGQIAAFASEHYPCDYEMGVHMGV
jgi:hypothetical protein